VTIPDKCAFVCEVKLLVLSIGLIHQPRGPRNGFCLSEGGQGRYAENPTCRPESRIFTYIYHRLLVVTCGLSELCVVSVRSTGVGERERERERARCARREFARGRESGGEIVVAIVRKTSSQVLYFVFCPFKVLVLICFVGIQRSGFKAASGFRGSRSPEPEKMVLEVEVCRSVGRS